MTAFIPGPTASTGWSATSGPQHLNQGLEDEFPAFIANREGQAMRSQHMSSTLSLEPLKDVYLYSTRDGNKNGNNKNVYLFSFVAAIILVIACINFVNLTTARSAERAKEVGIRKVVGALQTQLAGQFAGESIVLCLISFCLSLLFAGLLLPEFNQLSGKTISHGVFEHPAYIALLLAASLGIGAGIRSVYPVHRVHHRHHRRIQSIEVYARAGPGV